MGLWRTAGASSFGAAILMFLGWTLIVFMPNMFTLAISLIMTIIGAVLCCFSFVTVYLRALDTTFVHVMEYPSFATKNVLWQFHFRDGSAIFTKTLRRLESFETSERWQKIIKLWRTYNMGGHQVRIVNEIGIAASHDLNYCLYAEFAKREWKTRTFSELRKLFFKRETEPQKEQIMTIPEKTQLDKELQELEQHVDQLKRQEAKK